MKVATVEEVNLRQATIVSLTNETGRSSVTQLAQRFDVTPETIRRDLKSLEQQGLLRRVHGGAVSGSPKLNVDVLAVDDDDDLPIHQSQRRKQSIALTALSLIPGPEASIFIDAGSTTETFANVLARTYLGQNWLVVTTSPNVARTLSSAGVPDVIMVGGFVKARTQAIVGPHAIETLHSMRADIAFLGTNGIDPHKGFTTSDEREAKVKHEMIAHAQTSVILCDSGKIGHSSEVSFAQLADVDFVVTDRNSPPQLSRQLGEPNLQVVIP